MRTTEEIRKELIAAQGRLFEAFRGDDFITYRKALATQVNLEQELQAIHKKDAWKRRSR